jgi:hypothetical protein
MLRIGRRVGSVEDGTVFLTNLGGPFQRVQLTSLVRHHVAEFLMAHPFAASTIAAQRRVKVMTRS